ncbi:MULTISPECIES: TolC family outer membrane protein [Leeia]|uniref:TolC family outer membrane protein n=1 Tax=Leeia aquatica TaxID=2725557 RepID=A0A847RVK8_9NEIS|nr:TolC family outer membrane protein [Leeia aquatica]NLR75220.1 TolC family outer membrane protein [Leeia aquatica]
MKLRRHLLLLTLLGGSAHATDLMELYRQALQSDPSYAAALASHDATIERYPQARALLLPQINLSANTTWNEVDTELRSNGRDVHSHYNSNGIVIQAKQAIYNGQSLAQVEQGKLQVELAEVQRRAAEQDLILRVAQAYFDVLSAEDRVQLTVAQKEATTQQLALAKKSFEVGTATITDTHEAQARFDQIVAAEIAARNDLNVKQAALTQLTGKPVSHLARLDGKLPVSAPAQSSEAWQSRAEQGSLDVAAKQLLKEVASREIDRARAAHYPTLDLVATAAHNRTGGGSSPTNTTSGSIALQLNIPLYAGGALSSKSREAVAKEEQARDELEVARRKAVQDANSAYLGISSGAAQIRALEQALVSSESALKSTRLGQEVGVRTNLDVLNAQQNWYSTQRDLSAARYSYLLTALRLKATSGQLTESDLQEVNSRLKP